MKNLEEVQIVENSAEIYANFLHMLSESNITDEAMDEVIDMTFANASEEFIMEVSDAFVRKAAKSSLERRQELAGRAKDPIGLSSFKDAGKRQERFQHAKEMTKFKSDKVATPKAKSDSTKSGVGLAGMGLSRGKDTTSKTTSTGFGSVQPHSIMHQTDQAVLDHPETTEVKKHTTSPIKATKTEAEKIASKEKKQLPAVVGKSIAVGEPAKKGEVRAKSTVTKQATPKLTTSKVEQPKKETLRLTGPKAEVKAKEEPKQDKDKDVIEMVPNKKGVFVAKDSLKKTVRGARKPKEAKTEEVKPAKAKVEKVAKEVKAETKPAKTEKAPAKVKPVKAKTEKAPEQQKLALETPKKETAKAKTEVKAETKPAKKEKAPKATPAKAETPAKEVSAKPTTAKADTKVKANTDAIKKQLDELRKEQAAHKEDTRTLLRGGHREKNDALWQEHTAEGSKLKNKIAELEKQLSNESLSTFISSLAMSNISESAFMEIINEIKVSKGLIKKATDKRFKEYNKNLKAFQSAQPNSSEKQEAHDKAAQALTKYQKLSKMFNDRYEKKQEEPKKEESGFRPTFTRIL